MTKLGENKIIGCSKFRKGNITGHIGEACVINVDFYATEQFTLFIAFLFPLQCIVTIHPVQVR